MMFLWFSGFFVGFGAGILTVTVIAAYIGRQLLNEANAELTSAQHEEK